MLRKASDLPIAFLGGSSSGRVRSARAAKDSGFHSIGSGMTGMTSHVGGGSGMTGGTSGGTGGRAIGISGGSMSGKCSCAYLLNCQHG